MEVKVKKVKFKDIKDRYLTGFNRLKYKPEQYKVSSSGGSFLSLGNAFYTAWIYLKKLDVTYVVINCVGYIFLWGPTDKEDVLVLRYPGKVTYEDIKDDETFRAALEEAVKIFEEDLNAKDEEES